jgi:hypothetical protein
VDRYVASHYAKIAAGALVCALVLSAVFSVPFAFTLIGVSAWLFFVHLVTIDDDFPGGWSNPDGDYPVPWKSLLIKGAVLPALCLAASSPEVRRWGG